jgi:hypothetical protein
MYVLNDVIWHMRSLLQGLSTGTLIFYLLTLKFDLIFKIINIGHIFWIVSDRVLIFHMYVPCDKAFLMEP